MFALIIFGFVYFFLVPCILEVMFARFITFLGHLLLPFPLKCPSLALIKFGPHVIARGNGI